jgi:hypothetical protein
MTDHQFEIEVRVQFAIVHRATLKDRCHDGAALEARAITQRHGRGAVSSVFMLAENGEWLHAYTVVGEEIAPGPDYDAVERLNADGPRWCDHCGQRVYPHSARFVPSLRVPIDSANAGESAMLCRKCHATHEAGGTLLADRDPITGAEYGSIV